MLHSGRKRGESIKSERRESIKRERDSSVLELSRSSEKSQLLLTVMLFHSIIHPFPSYSLLLSQTFLDPKDTHTFSLADSKRKKEREKKWRQVSRDNHRKTKCNAGKRSFEFENVFKGNDSHSSFLSFLFLFPSSFLSPSSPSLSLQGMDIQSIHSSFHETYLWMDSDRRISERKKEGERKKRKRKTRDRETKNKEREK